MLIDKVCDNPKWRGKDDFPSSPEWKNEIEKWLQFLQEKKQLEEYKPRLNDSKTRRDEAFAEISSAYYLETNLGYKILRWNEKTNGTRDVDFVIRVDADEVYTEVKSPGWEGELQPAERISGRKDLPKHINADVRFTAPWRGIRHAISKSYPKFLPQCKNLVVMRDDLFLGPLGVPGQPEIALFEKNGLYDDEKGYFADKRFENVGGILMLEVVLPVGAQVRYKSQFISNQNAQEPINLSSRLASPLL